MGFSQDVRQRLGIDGRITSMVYLLEVKKNKKVNFSIDFKGSNNLELATGGLTATTLVDEFSERQVAYLQVVDPQKGWSLECKYNWEELDPHQASPGKPVREELAPGIVLITTREDGPYSFKYELLVTKFVVVNFTLDCTGSANMKVANSSRKNPFVRKSSYSRTTAHSSARWSLCAKKSRARSKSSFHGRRVPHPAERVPSATDPQAEKRARQQTLPKRASTSQVCQSGKRSALVSI